MPGHPPATSRRTLLDALAATLLARVASPRAARAEDDISPTAALPDADALDALGLVATHRAAVAAADRTAIARLLPAADPAADAWQDGAVLITTPADPDARFSTAGLAIDAWPDAATAAAVAAACARTFALAAVHLPDHASVRDVVPGLASAAYIDAEAEHIDVLVVGYVASCTLVGWVSGGLDCDPLPASRLVRAAFDRLAGGPASEANAHAAD
jgi:hypothetical protein